MAIMGILSRKNWMILLHSWPVCHVNCVIFKAQNPFCNRKCSKFLASVLMADNFFLQFMYGKT